MIYDLRYMLGEDLRIASVTYFKEVQLKPRKDDACSGAYWQPQEEKKRKKS